MPALRKSLSVHEPRLSGAQLFVFDADFQRRDRHGQAAEQLPGHFEVYASQIAVAGLVPLLAICLHGISTPFMEFRLRTHTRNFPAKSMCLVPSGECPDQSDWDITYLTVCFWLFPHPGCVSGFSHVLSPSGCLCCSSIQHLTS